LKHAPDVAERVREIMESLPEGPDEPDPDTMLYDGGFFTDGDRATLDRLRALHPTELSWATPVFDDPRLPEMLFRYRARNYPETLNADEALRWEEYRLSRLTVPGCGSSLVRSGYEARLRELEALPNLSSRQKEIIDSLWAYLRDIAS
jgi:exodeoxyribonuclease-1